MPLKRIFQLFKRVISPRPSRPVPRKDRFLPTPKGPPSKRPTLPPWAKKDWFAQKDMGTMVPPEDLAEEASLRRPGEWLKNKLGGGERSQVMEKIRKLANSSKGRPGLSDEELEGFLKDFLSTETPGGEQGQEKDPAAKKEEPEK